MYRPQPYHLAVFLFAIAICTMPEVVAAQPPDMTQHKDLAREIKKLKAATETFTEVKEEDSRIQAVENENLKCKVVRAKLRT